MRILITGGTGLIGSRLAERATALGHEVRVTGLSRNPAEAEAQERLAAIGIEPLVGDLLRPGLATEAVQGVELVYHLAAAQHEAGIAEQRFWDVNVGATRLLLRAAEAAGVRRMVHAGTIGVHGSTRLAQDERSPPAPDNIYGLTKLAGERLVLAHPGRMETVVLRIGETYGPGDRRLLKLFRGLARGWPVLVGQGLNLHQPIHLDDLLPGLLAAAERPGIAGEAILLAGPAPVSSLEMARAIAAAVGGPPPRPGPPLVPMRLLAALTETIFRPLGRQPPLHRRRLDFFEKSLVFDMVKAERLLGFRPAIGFAAGARATAASYRAQGIL